MKNKMLNEEMQNDILYEDITDEQICFLRNVNKSFFRNFQKNIYTFRSVPLTIAYFNMIFRIAQKVLKMKKINIKYLTKEQYDEISKEYAKYF